LFDQISQRKYVVERFCTQFARSLGGHRKSRFGDCCGLGKRVPGFAGFVKVQNRAVLRLRSHFQPGNKRFDSLLTIEICDTLRSLYGKMKKKRGVEK